MKLSKTITASILAAIVSCWSAVAFAIPSFSLSPTPALGDVGDSIYVDLLWDGDGANYLGDFDVDITYDSSIVSYAGSTIDPDFAVDSFGCFICGDDSVPGTVDIYEVSFDFPADLMANQDSLGNAFTLATLEFIGLTEGITDLVLSGTFGNEFGLGFNYTTSDGQICVGPNGCGVVPPVSVAEPGSYLSLAGIALLFLARTRKTQAKSA